MSRTAKRRAGWFLGVTLLLNASVAYGAGGVIVNPFTGSKKKAVRERIVKALESSGTEVLPESAGQVTVDSPPKAYRKVATRHGARAFVDGHVVMGKKGWTVTLTVRNGADGKVLDTAKVRAGWLPALMKRIDAEASTALGAIEEADAPAAGQSARRAATANETGAAEPPVSEPAAAPAEREAAASADPAAAATEEPAIEPEAEPAEKAPVQEPDASVEADPAEDAAPKAREEAKSTGPKPYPLELAASFGVFSRTFEYHQDVNENLRPYRLPFGPTSALRARWYPAAHFTDEMPAHIGIVGEFERSAGTSSTTEEGERFGTAMQQFSVGSRWRALGRHHEFGVSFVYGQHSYLIDGDRASGATAANGLPVDRDYVPDVSYSYLRPGFDARIGFGIFHVGAGFGYRSVISMGDVGEDAWFPRATAAAIDASLGGGVEVIRDLTLTLGVDVRRYALDMNVEAGDIGQPRDVAGGAVDQYVAGRLGIEWRLPGDEGAQGERRWNFAGTRGRKQAQ